MAARRGKQQARRHGQRRTPGWVWLFSGLLLGGAIMAFVYVRMPHALDNLIPHPNPSARPHGTGDVGVAPEGGIADASSVAKKREYDFYKLLPEKEVVIPDEELSARVKAEEAAKLAAQQQANAPIVPVTSATAAPTTPTPAANANPVAPPDANANPPTSPDANAAVPSVAAASAGQYLLQAGAFRNGAQADDLKARIALLGLVGRVEIVQTPAGEMHRVRLGPYATASELEQAKQKLGGGGISAVAIRVK
jgi:cell division protein FtsN